MKSWCCISRPMSSTWSAEMRTKKSERYPEREGPMWPRPCQECGAVVGEQDMDLHDQWHEQIEEAFATLAVRTER